LLVQRPADAQVLVGCGRLALAEQRASEAEDLTRRALACDSYDRDAHVLASQVAGAVGKTDEARRHEVRAAQIDADERRLPALKVEVNAKPGNVPLLFELGTVLLRLGHKEKAQWALQTVLRLEPGTPAQESLERLQEGGSTG